MCRKKGNTVHAMLKSEGSVDWNFKTKKPQKTNIYNSDSMDKSKHLQLLQVRSYIIHLHSYISYEAYKKDEDVAFTGSWKRRDTLMEKTVSFQILSQWLVSCRGYLKFSPTNLWSIDCLKKRLNIMRASAFTASESYWERVLIEYYSMWVFLFSVFWVNQNQTILLNLSLCWSPMWRLK